MATASADRNLLFGVLAVQLDFVSRDDLIAATSRWILDKETPLSEVFVEQGMLSREESQLIDGVVRKHLERNGDDPRQSLKSLEAFEAVRATLKGIDDTDVKGTVEFDTLATPSTDQYTTLAPVTSEIADSKQRFTFLRVHQKGGLGCVSIALDEELHREIALKEILPAHADHEENRNRFIREAEITGALEHPGVVPVYSLGHFADGRPFYAMRFIHGLNLQDAVTDFYKDTSPPAEKQLQFRQLVAKIIHVCHALDYAHSRGVIHRDIKPSNIMLGDYGETLVVDWGLAKTLTDPTQTDESIVPKVQTTQRASSTSTQIGRVVGTPSFMSPEQAAGRLDALDATSDIYSLGSTLYHVLTGSPPFKGNEEEVLGNVQMSRFPKPREINPQVPRALEAICLKAMARLPQDRYQSARGMSDDLERFMADERVLAYREPLPARAWRWIRNHKALVLSSAAALTVAVTALTIGVVLLSAANVRERTAREQAQSNFVEATQQRELAQRNFDLARSAVRGFLTDVSENTLIQQPGMQNLRQELLRRALVYYQDFLEQRQDDPSLQGEVAEANYLVGTIVQLVDSPKDALPHFERAVELQEQLLESSPDNSEVQRSYGQTLNAMGGALLRLGRIEESRDYFQQSADVREELAKNAPEDVEAARMFASSVMNIGNTYRAVGEWDKALPLFERAQMIRMAKVDKIDTTDPKLQRDLGMGYYNLAVVRRISGDDVVAETNFLAAIDLFSKLHASEPHEMSHQRNLALCLRGEADLKVNREEPEAAIEYYQQAIELLEELKLRNPEVHSYAFELAGVYINLASQWQTQENNTVCIKSAQRGVNLLEELAALADSMPTYRRDLGIAHRLLGELQDANGDTDSAEQELLASKAVFSKLLSENPANENYAQELGLTMDRLTALELSRVPQGNEDSPP
ncbi:protein kinase domain-containing protein [Bythopirellula polymerisocia]|uniref:Serine/threonine-protein kinase PknD n=1 Tax=Bythopirellula polymerisocia TaxID=2528003 RepID=A0A5C6CCT0_9BACT|nr:serine/threonine-protein kinase [Bythopirellula polymerisocia]TWU21922.1 Serine/threonine-protein kinase PknD [Bythopirellula polymerisocia]